MRSLKLAQSNRRVRVVWLGVTAGLAMLCLALLIWGLQQATLVYADPGILYVDGTAGQDIGTCGTAGAPCESISYTLISRASSGDAIRVAQGVYTENLSIDKQITLEGGYSGLPDWERDVGLYVTVLDGSNSRTVVGDWDGNSVHYSDVIEDDGMYKMWYLGTDVYGVQRIGYATSVDGLEWVKYDSNPVLDVGAEGEWDAVDLESHYVIKEGPTTYKMWYMGRDKDLVWRMGLATSLDGIHWTKHASNPVLDLGNQVWNNRLLHGPTLLHEEGLYKMWLHTAGDGGAGWIPYMAYATSSDGITWIWDAINPLFSRDPSHLWEANWILSPSVVHEAGSYQMWYTGESDNGPSIGYATSVDETTWSKYNSGVAPVLRGTPGEWDDGYVRDPIVLYAGGTYTMYYDNNLSIGMAASTDGITWIKSPDNPVLSPGTLHQWGQPVVSFVGGATSGSVLDGFTVQNGEAEYGGGIYIDGASPIISGCVIVENRANTAGGGGFITGNASPLIFASQILSNTAQDGAGLAIYSGATPLIDNNSIISNTADWAGGGVRVLRSGGTIQNNYIASNKAHGWAGGAMEIAVNAWTTVISNSIVGNTADTGGGIAVGYYCTITIAANEIVSNSTTDWAGGGIYIGDYSTITIDRNTISKNRAEGGGGVAINGSSVTATNNVIASNMGLTSTGEGDGIVVFTNTNNSDARIINNTIAFNTAEGIQVNAGTVLARNNIVYSNGGGIHNYNSGAMVSSDHNAFWDNGWDYGNVSPGPGDISADPKFVNAATDDFHLLSASPCIDAGSNVGAPSTDFDNDPRPLDGDLNGMATTDMGADEFRAYQIYLPLIFRNIGR